MTKRFVLNKPRCSSRYRHYRIREILLCEHTVKSIFFFNREHSPLKVVVKISDKPFKGAKDMLTQNGGYSVDGIKFNMYPMARAFLKNLFPNGSELYLNISQHKSKAAK